MKLLILAIVAVAQVVCQPEAEAARSIQERSADPEPHRSFGFGRESGFRRGFGRESGFRRGPYGIGHHYGKRSADAEPHRSFGFGRESGFRNYGFGRESGFRGNFGFGRESGFRGGFGFGRESGFRGHRFHKRAADEQVDALNDEEITDLTSPILADESEHNIIERSAEADPHRSYGLGRESGFRGSFGHGRESGFRGSFGHGRESGFRGNFGFGRESGFRGGFGFGRESGFRGHRFHKRGTDDITEETENQPSDDEPAVQTEEHIGQEEEHSINERSAEPHRSLSRYGSPNRHINAGFGRESGFRNSNIRFGAHHIGKRSADPEPHRFGNYGQFGYGGFERPSYGFGREGGFGQYGHGFSNNYYGDIWA